MSNPEFVSLSCSFFHLGEKNLVVAGADVLRVFQMVPEVTLLLTKIHDTCSQLLRQCLGLLMSHTFILSNFHNVAPRQCLNQLWRERISSQG